MLLYTCILHSLHLNKTVLCNYVVLHGRTHLEKKEINSLQETPLAVLRPSQLQFDEMFP